MIEAGLGGRLDATNVIPSQLTVLTSVGLDHTRMARRDPGGDRRREARGAWDHTALITGLVPAEVEPVIEREVEGKHAARIVESRSPRRRMGPRATISRKRAVNFRMTNVALAMSAAQEALGQIDSEKVKMLLTSRSLGGRNWSGATPTSSMTPPTTLMERGRCRRRYPSLQAAARSSAASRSSPRRTPARSSTRWPRCARRSSAPRSRRRRSGVRDGW